MTHATQRAGKARRFPSAARGWAWLCACALLLFISLATAEQRFPPPEFETGHTLPATTTPAARAVWLDYLDIAVLAGALGVATWLAFKKRSRKGVIALSIFSIAYFGFWKKGCVCAIGSIQNVALGVFDSSYAVPLVVSAFFILPLAVALFAGRSFCSGVCPHGALQDLVLFKPLKVPLWLEHSLGVLPFIYLGAAVLFAATGSAFLICEYDPFIPIFRMSGRSLMVYTGIALLAIGLFVGRPYCRFLCPFGALLRMGSSVSRWRVRVTPDICTRCKLCEASCPFGAMRVPEEDIAKPAELAQDRRWLGGTLLLLPILILAGVWLGGFFAKPASRMHPTVEVADQLLKLGDAPPPTGTLTPEQMELERVRQAPEGVIRDAAKIRRKFEIGSRVFGGWVGLVIGAKLISLGVRRRRTDYEPDSGACVSCARCFETCPQEMLRRGIVPPPSVLAPEPAPVQPAAAARGSQKPGEMIKA